MYTVGAGGQVADVALLTLLYCSPLSNGRRRKAVLRGLLPRIRALAACMPPRDEQVREPAAADSREPANAFHDPYVDDER